MNHSEKGRRELLVASALFIGLGVISVLDAIYWQRNFLLHGFKTAFFAALCYFMLKGNQFSRWAVFAIGVFGALSMLVVTFISEVPVWLKFVLLSCSLAYGAVAFITGKSKSASQYLRSLKGLPKEA